MPLRFGAFDFDPQRRQLLRGEEEVHLTPRTLRFLEVLLEQRPRAVSKRELMTQVWPDAFVEESNLKTIASELRAALNDDGREVIRTVQRFGYAFAGDVFDDAAPQVSGYVLFGENLRVPLSRSESVIGRDPRCEVWIDSPEVSRRHARIVVRDQRPFIEDLNSKNGTLIGSQPVSEQTELHDGDRLQLGAILLVFRVCSGQEATRSQR
jgi:DNA-binding winged helix-turn-helix (wHTH) protein